MTRHCVEACAALKWRRGESHRWGERPRRKEKCAGCAREAN